MAMLIKGITAIFFLLFVPAATGCVFLKKNESFEAAKAYVSGYLCIFAVAELLLLPCIYLKMSLNFFSLIYLMCCLCLSVLGLIRLYQKKPLTNLSSLSRTAFFSGVKKIFTERIFLTGTIGIIGVQFVTNILYHRPDADDAFYVAAAVTDLYENSVFHIDPYTGFPYQQLPVRYVLSPFPDFLAFISRMCQNLHPAILAHTIFPVLFGLLVYAVHRMIAKKMFPAEKKKQDLYLFFLALLISFSCVSVYNSGTFQMIRIWQGKALLASALLPALVYFCTQVIIEKKGSVFFLLMADLACCLPSSMGVILSGIIMGTFFLLSLFLRKGLRSCVNCVLAVFPSITLGLCYLFLS